MSGAGQSRRDFMSGALALGGGLLLSRADAAALIMPGGPQLLLFDPARSDARDWLASARAPATRPITGDRVRFARELFGGAAAPGTVAGLTSYADFILLSGTAAEAGYRLLSERLCPAAGVHRQGVLVHWVLARRR